MAFLLSLFAAVPQMLQLSRRAVRRSKMMAFGIAVGVVYSQVQWRGMYLISVWLIIPADGSAVHTTLKAETLL